MSTVEKSRAGANFGAIQQKARGLLTAKDRRILALHQAIEQAERELENCRTVISQQQCRESSITERLTTIKAALHAEQEEQ